LPKYPLRAVDRSPSAELPALAVFARAASPGKAKTRLIPLLGTRGAAALHAALLVDTLRKFDSLSGRVALYVFLTGRGPSVPRTWGAYRLARQRGSDLGERLERAFRRLLRRHPRAVVIGTDSPALRPRLLLQALGELRVCDAVLGPCPDGGYYLIGLRRGARGGMRGVFRGVRWGSARAFRDTLGNLLAGGFCCSILEPLADVDRPADFRRLARELASSQAARRLTPAVWRFVRSLEGAGKESKVRRPARTGLAKRKRRGRSRHPKRGGPALL
jgi:rSAM/selenodomain-associated transferase 1